jgi:hypothetical protein
MGFLTGGPFYDMIGRTGNNVGRRVRGKNVFSMRPAKSNKPATELQLIQREKLSLVAAWLRRMTSIIRTGFKAFDAEMSEMNAAVSYNLKHAVTPLAPYAINYAKVLYSKGFLDLPSVPEINIITAAKLNYSWPAITSSTNAEGTDKVTFMVYNPDKDKFVILKAGAIRSALAYVLSLPGDFSGDTVEAYISFESADGKLVSDSFYVGSFVVL